MNNKFYYRLYGINIESPIEFKELIRSKKTNDDIIITYGNVPEEVLIFVGKGRKGYCSKKIMWFYIEEVGIYYISEGKSIIIQSYKNAKINEIKAYLLGTALGIIIIQRNIIAVHGGTILVDKKAITIVGNTGAGKSTLISRLRSRGYSFMSDDVSVLSGNMVNFSYPQQRLCKDTMKEFKYDLDKYMIIDENREKYSVDIEENFIMEQVELKAIFEISTYDEEKVMLKEVKGSEKLLILMNNIYRGEIIRIIGLNNEYLKKCLNLINHIHLYKIQRPNNKFSVDAQIKLIEDVVKAI